MAIRYDHSTPELAKPTCHSCNLAELRVIHLKQQLERSREDNLLMRGQIFELSLKTPAPLPEFTP